MNLHHRTFWPTTTALAALLIIASVGRTYPVRAEHGRKSPQAVRRAASFTQLDLYPNINTVGVVVSGSSLPTTVGLWMRRTGDTDWHAAHPLMLIGDGRLVGSLFNLAANTSYDIRVSDGASEITGSVTTQVDELQFAASAVVHVDAGAAPGGDGSAAAPFQTIQDGVDHASPGTQVLVAAGVYHEAVTFPSSGTPGQWIEVKADGAAVLDGSETLSGNVWTLEAGTDHTYSTPIAASIAYLARDDLRFYAYDTRADLDQGIGHNGVPMAEGWFFDALTSQLFVRSLDDPSSHVWHVPTLDRAFDAVSQDWIWIEGFEMRYYGVTVNGCGVCTTDASHLVIRNNQIHNLQLGIFFNWTGGADRGNDTRVEYNDISDPPVDQWPWSSVDGSSMEGTAIVVRGHVGAIVRDNQLHNIFNGIYVGSSAQLENSDLAFDTDIYDNVIHNIGDDGLEPEGACINARFRSNTVDSSFVGISLAPVTQGPAWVLRSVFSNFHGRAFKWDRSSDGIVLIYHNTSWSTVANINAMDMISSVNNAVLRNNIFQSAGYGVYEVATGSTGHDWNDDDWYVTRSAPHYVWENVPYATLADLCTGTGLECNGYEVSPGMTDPAGGDFTLLYTSPNVDRGVLIPGINDSFSGTAPDIGAFELGLPRVQPAEGAQVCLRPSIVVDLPLSDLMRTASGAFDPSTVTLALDSTDITALATIIENTTYPASRARIMYTPDSDLALGPHEASFIFPVEGGSHSLLWTFDVTNTACTSALQTGTAVPAAAATATPTPTLTSSRDGVRPPQATQAPFRRSRGRHHHRGR